MIFMSVKNTQDNDYGLEYVKHFISKGVFECDFLLNDRSFKIKL